MNAESDHLFIEPGGEKQSELVDRQLCSHEYRPHPSQTYEAPQGHEDALLSPRKRTRATGWSKPMSEFVAQMRTRLTSGRGSGNNRAGGVHVPVNSTPPDAELELEAGVGMSRARRAYQNLSKGPVGCDIRLQRKKRPMVRVFIVILNASIVVQIKSLIDTMRRGNYSLVAMVNVTCHNTSLWTSRVQPFQGL